MTFVLFHLSLVFGCCVPWISEPGRIPSLAYTGKPTTVPEFTYECGTYQSLDAQTLPFSNLPILLNAWTVVLSFNFGTALCFQSVIGTSVLIGTVSLRQVRVKDEPCDIPYQKLVNPNCRYGYDDDSKETDPLGANDTLYYGDSYLTRSGDVRGVHGRYDGGGYQVLLPRTRLVQNKALILWMVRNKFVNHFENSWILQELIGHNKQWM